MNPFQPAASRESSTLPAWMADGVESRARLAVFRDAPDEAVRVLLATGRDVRTVAELLLRLRRERAGQVRMVGLATIAVGMLIALGTSAGLALGSDMLPRSRRVVAFAVAVGAAGFALAARGVPLVLWPDRSQIDVSGSLAGGRSPWLRPQLGFAILFGFAAVVLATAASVMYF